MEKQYVLITGGSQGIGEGIASRLSEDGYSPIILDIVEPERGVNAEFLQIDLSDKEAKTKPPD